MNKLVLVILKFIYKVRQSIFITKKQYRLRLLDCYTASNRKIIAVVQVAVKRVKIKFSVRYLMSNKYLLLDIHPISSCRLAFIATLEDELSLNEIPNHIKNTFISTSIIKEEPTLIIKERNFPLNNTETYFTIVPIATPEIEGITMSAEELAKNEDILYSLGSVYAASVGVAAGKDYLSMLKKSKNKAKITTKPTPNFRYFHILCVAYVGLILSGISIVRRLFPYHIPFTDIIIPFGAGIIFFPLTFFIQDITTEVYGFSRARHMVWLAIIMILFYIFYTQIAIHLPSGSELIYKNNESFAIVFNTIPRQLLALIISLLIGSLINDFFISKSKIIFGGQYLWARVLGSTMVGEGVLQVVGGIIGFSDTLDFYTQLLPNMILAYGYKLLWNAATIPLIYLVATYLKKLEGIDVFDYNVNYSPFKLSTNL